MQKNLTRFIAKPLLALALVGLSGTAVMAKKAPASLEAQMKSALHITKAQEGVWKQFVSAYNYPFKPSQQLSINQYNALDLPARVAFLKKVRAEETAFVNRRHDASLALYEKLNAKQKKKFNDMNAMRAPKAQPKK